MNNVANFNHICAGPFENERYLGKRKEEFIKKKTNQKSRKKMERKKKKLQTKRDKTKE